MAIHSRICIRITSDERKLAENLSQELFGKINLSQLIVRLIRNAAGEDPFLSSKEMLEFINTARQLTGIARNLNQISRKINAEERNLEQLSVSYINSLIQEVETTKHTVNKVINKAKLRLIGDSNEF